MSTFFAMNSYGFFIWSAYGVTAIALVAELVALRSLRKSVLADARLMASDGGTETLGAAE